jgi:translation initiation factor IF-3
LQLAKSQGLDLVLVSSDSTPPVCKLENFSLVMLNQEKKEKVQRANQRANTVKEMLLTLGIDPHDFQTKMDRVKDFIDDGHQVKITVVLFKRGFRKVQQHAARVGANVKGAPIIEINEMTRHILSVAENLSATVRQNDLFVHKLVAGTGENASEPPEMSEVLNKREFLLSPKTTAPASHNKKK